MNGNDKQVVKVLTTAEAAKALNRAVGTLRIWACKGGPVTPVRINGRLGWPLNEINRLLTEGGSK